MKKKVINFLAVVVIAFVIVGTGSVFAAEEPEVAVVVEGAVIKDGVSSGGYARIFDAGQLNALTDCINNNRTARFVNEEGANLFYSAETLPTVGIKLFNDVIYTAGGIGNADHPFRGSISGQGFTLSLNGGSLIKYGTNVNVCDITLKGAYSLASEIKTTKNSIFYKVTALQNVGGFFYSGALIGRAEGTGGIIIEDCTAYCKVNGQYAGGFVGYSACELTVVNCSVEGEITGENCGGITGYSKERLIVDNIILNVSFSEGKRAAICPYAEYVEIRNVEYGIACKGSDGADLFLETEELRIKNVKYCSKSGSAAVFALKSGVITMENCIVIANTKGQRTAVIALSVGDADIKNCEIGANCAGETVGGLFVEAEKLSLFNCSINITVCGDEAGGIAYSARELNISANYAGKKIVLNIAAVTAAGIAVFTENCTIFNADFRIEIEANRAAGLLYKTGFYETENSDGVEKEDKLLIRNIKCEIYIKAVELAAGISVYAREADVKGVNGEIYATANEAGGLFFYIKTGKIYSCFMLISINAQGCAGIAAETETLELCENLFCGAINALTVAATVLRAEFPVSVRNNSLMFSIIREGKAYIDYEDENAVMVNNVFCGIKTEFGDGNRLADIQGLWTVYNGSHTQLPYGRGAIYRFDYEGFKEETFPKDSGAYKVLCTAENLFGEVLYSFYLPFFIKKQVLPVLGLIATEYVFNGNDIVPVIDLKSIGGPAFEATFIFYDNEGNRSEGMAGKKDLTGVYYNWRNNTYFIDCFIETANYRIEAYGIMLSVKRVSVSPDDTSFYPFFNTREESKVFDGAPISFEIELPGLSGVSYYVTYSGKLYDGTTISNSNIPPILPGEYTASLHIVVPQGYTNFTVHSRITDSFKFDIKRLNLIVKPISATIYVSERITPKIIIDGFEDRDNIYYLGGFETLKCDSFSSASAGSYKLKTQGDLISPKYKIVYEEAEITVIKYSAKPLISADVNIRMNGNVLEVFSERRDLIFSLNGGEYQRTPYFKLERGSHTLYIKSAETASVYESAPISFEVYCNGYPYSAVVTSSVMLAVAFLAAYVYCRKTDSALQKKIKSNVHG